MAMKLPTPPTQAPSRGLPATSGNFSTGCLRILARLLGESASPVRSGMIDDKSRMRPLASMIPGFSRPRGPKRTSFIATLSLWVGRDFVAEPSGVGRRREPPATRLHTMRRYRSEAKRLDAAPRALLQGDGGNHK